MADNIAKTLSDDASSPMLAMVGRAHLSGLKTRLEAKGFQTQDINLARVEN